MLVSLSTQLARAKRLHKPLVFVQVTTLEIAVAAVRAAEHEKRSIVLTIDADHPLLYSLDYQVAATLQLGRMSRAEVTVEVITGANHLAVEQALMAGAQVVSPQVTNISESQMLALFGWAANQAVAQGAELMADFSYLHSSDWHQRSHALSAKHQVAGFRAPLLDKDMKLQAAALAADVKTLKLPVIAAAAEYRPSQLRRFTEIGVNGVTFTEVLDEAFTAGLRTALRNRSHNLARYYLPKGQLAVEEFLVTTFRQLCLK
jgi:hypothetical protein